MSKVAKNKSVSKGQKPYISRTGIGNKGVWEVLDGNGQTAATFRGDEQLQAQIYLKRNWEALVRGEHPAKSAKNNKALPELVNVGGVIYKRVKKGK